MSAKADRKTYVVKVYFDATPDEYEALGVTILDAVETALGCTDGNHECPHFQAATSGPRRHEGRRLWALRCGLGDLWNAIRYGEV